MSRPKVSMKEVMGSSAGVRKLSFDNLSDTLGEKMPNLPKNKVGKVRLLQALRNRFGKGFRNLPGVQDVLKDFDAQIDGQTKLNKMRMIKAD